MLTKRLFILICFWGTILSQAQKTETHKLLEQADNMVLENPKQSLAIAQYTLNLAENHGQKALAHNICATAFYMMGQYDQALNQVFESENLHPQEKNSELNLKNNSLKELIFYRLDLKGNQSLFSHESLNQYDFFQPIIY